MILVTAHTFGNSDIEIDNTYENVAFKALKKNSYENREGWAPILVHTFERPGLEAGRPYHGREGGGGWGPESTAPGLTHVTR